MEIKSIITELVYSCVFVNSLLKIAQALVQALVQTLWFLLRFFLLLLLRLRTLGSSTRFKHLVQVTQLISINRSLASEIDRPLKPIYRTELLRRIAEQNYLISFACFSSFSSFSRERSRVFIEHCSSLLPERLVPTSLLKKASLVKIFLV